MVWPVQLGGDHCDDIEIGCGGTLLQLARRHPHLDVTWVVLSATDERAREAQASADRFLSGARSRALVVERFRDGYLPHEGPPVKDCFERLKSRVTADVYVNLTVRRHDGVSRWG